MPVHPGDFEYRAFISYSHQDSRWASWLMRKLESYRTPRRLIGSEGRYGKVSDRLIPIFRDREELSTGEELSAVIQHALARSAALIVIASESACHSKWVNHEVVNFKSLYPERPILTLIVSGDPSDEGGRDDCFPSGLKYALNKDGTTGNRLQDILAADVRSHADGRRGALQKIIAGLLGVPLGSLVQREAQRRSRRLLSVTAAALAGMAIAIALAVAAQLARLDADRRRDQAEDLLGFMVGDLRDSLEPIGKLALLERVGDKAMDYFATVEPADVSNAGLANQVRVLTQIGSIRLAQHQHEAAVDVFERAYLSSEILTEKSPDDTGLLFARGQAEFWVGYAQWQQGNLDKASEWMARYRDTGLSLLDFDKSNAEWQREVGYGYHNIGAIELKRGNISEAKASFELELALLTDLADSPDYHDRLQPDIADCHSWLGTTMEWAGQPEESLAYFRSSRTTWESLYNVEPDHAAYIEWLANALVLEFNAQRQLSGQREHYSGLDRALTMRRRLTEMDPDNTNWLEDYHKLRVFKLEHVLAFGHDDGATGAALKQSLDIIERINAAANARSERTLAALLRAYRLMAVVEYRQGNREDAMYYLQKAIELVPELEARVLEVDLVTQLTAVLRLQAEVLASGGEVVQAARQKAEALKTITRAADNSKHARILNEYSEILALNDRVDEARAIRSHLDEIGYKPLWLSSN